MNHFEWHWTQENREIFAQGWNPPVTKAVICLVHGFAEHSSRYAHVAERLGKEGFAVLAYDQFGHGKTEGPRGFSPSYEASMQSVKILLEEAETRFPTVPKILYGHSMGGNVMLNFLLQKNPEVAGAIASAPWMQLGFDPPAFQLFLASVMKNIYPKFPEKANINADGISRDKEEVRKYVTDPLNHNTARAGTFSETFQAGKWLLNHSQDLKVPLLLMHGTEDKLIAYKGSKDFFEKGNKDLITFKSFENYYHELHNEPAEDREKVFVEITNWINTLIGK